MLILQVAGAHWQAFAAWRKQCASWCHCYLVRHRFYGRFFVCPPTFFNRPAHRRASRYLSFSHTESWILNVNLNILVRTVLLYHPGPSLQSLDRNIALKSLSLYPRSHPKRVIVSFVSTILPTYDGRAIRCRKKDLNRCIVHCTEAIFLCPVTMNDLVLTSSILPRIRPSRTFLEIQTA